MVLYICVAAWSAARHSTLIYTQLFACCLQLFKYRSAYSIQTERKRKSKYLRRRRLKCVCVRLVLVDLTTSTFSLNMYQIENKRAIHITVTVWHIAHDIQFSFLYTKRRIYYKWLTDCDSTLCNSSNDVNQIKRNDRPPTTIPCYGHHHSHPARCSAWSRRMTTMKCLALQRLLKFSINNNNNENILHEFIQWEVHIGAAGMSRYEFCHNVRDYYVTTTTSEHSLTKV